MSNATITTERISTNEWVAVREDFDGAPDSNDLMGYGDTETEARENLVFLETERSQLNQLSGEQLRHLRRDWDDKGGSDAVDRGTLKPFHVYLESADTFSDGTPIVFDESGQLVTEPMPVVDRDPINRLLADEKEYDPTWNGFKKDVTPTDVQGVILSAIGVLLLIAIGAAAGVK